MFDLWILNSSIEKKEKKTTLYTVYCMVSFKSLEPPDDRVRHISVLRGNTLTWAFSRFTWGEMEREGKGGD